MEAFRHAVEAREFQSIGELFAEHVSFHSPIAFAPYAGRELVAKIVNIVASIFEDFRFERMLVGESGDLHALMFGARIGDLSIQGCDFLHTGHDGLIDEFTVMLRPLKAVHAFEERMRAQFGAMMTAD